MLLEALERNRLNFVNFLKAAFGCNRLRFRIDHKCKDLGIARPRETSKCLH